jgi:hypothetical protein
MKKFDYLRVSRSDDDRDASSIICASKNIADEIASKAATSGLKCGVKNRNLIFDVTVVTGMGPEYIYICNFLGSLGWEMVESAAPGAFLFKREINE